MRAETPLVIVDDDPLYGRILCDFFGQRGYSPVLARTVRAGETAVREIQPAVALIDIYLEDGDGLDLCRWIRDHAADTATLLMTARPEGFALGDNRGGIVDDFFIKSNDLVELARRVAARVEQASSLRALRRRERLLAAVGEVAQATASFTDLGELARVLAPLLLKLPGVQGARVEAPPVGHAGDARLVTLLEVGRLNAVNEHVDAIPLPDSGEGWLILQMESDEHLDRDVVETLARLVSSAITAGRCFESLRTRQVYLEHGYAARQRQVAWMQARLERLTDARDSMVALLSHDLRGPLSVILGHCQLSEETGFRPETVRKGIEVIRRQADRMNKMVEELLDRYRNDRVGGMATELGDLGVLARELAPVLEPIAQRKGQILRLQIDGPAPVEANLPELREVLANLIENAIRHSPDGSSIDIAVHTREGRVYGSVRDRGPGFGRGGAPGGSGLGLGLQASSRIVATAGGRLVVDDHPEGGAVVRFDLPVATERPGGVWILLAGRDADRLDRLSESMGRTWDTSVFTDLAAAVPRLRRSPPAVVVVDLDEGQDDVGIELVRLLKDDPDLALIPVLAVVPPSSANPWNDRLTRLGTYAIFRRPVDHGRIQERIRNAIREVNDAATSFVGRRADSLTGAETVEFFLARMPALIQESRSAQAPLPIVVVDVPGLADVNLTWGWAIGDHLLVWLAKELRDRCAAGEWCVRSGGGRFLLVTAERSLIDAERRATELSRWIAGARPRLGVTRVPVQVRTLTVDAVTLSSDPEAWTSLVRGDEEA